MGVFTDFKAQDSSLLCDPNVLEIKAGNVSSNAQSIAVEVDPITRTLRLKTD
jgi:hypothetical protein